MAVQFEVDIKKVEELASKGLTREQVALSLGVTARTLRRKKKVNPDIEEAYQKGRAKGIGIIANALFEKAVKGNTTAQIFFLKCNGWKESSEVEVKNTTPVKIVIKDDLT